MNDYVFKLVMDNPKLIINLIRGYTTDWLDHSTIDYANFTMILDEERVFKAIQKLDLGSLTDEEKRAVDVFLKVYQEKKQRGEANLSEKSQEDKRQEDCCKNNSGKSRMFSQSERLKSSHLASKEKVPGYRQLAVQNERRFS